MAKIKQQYDRASWTILASLIICCLIIFSQYNRQTILHTISQRLDLLLYDIRFNVSLAYKNYSHETHNIVIVDIDEASLKEIGHWPWERKTLGKMTERILEAGAAVITFDMVFSEPEINTVAEIKNNLPPEQVQLNDYLTSLSPQYDHDRILADAFSQGDIILGFIFHQDNFTVSELPDSNLLINQGLIPELPVIQMDGYTANIPILRNSVLAEGFINGPPDPDGIVRRAPLVLRYEDSFFASLALQTALAYNLEEQATINTYSTEEDVVVTSIGIGEQKIPTDKTGQMLIPYRGGQKFYPYISAANTLSPDFDMSIFQGAIVFVGTSAIGLVDLRSTPVGVQYPGVESQASIVDAILTGDVPYRPDWAAGANIAAIILIFFLLNIIFPVCGPLAMVIMGTLVSLAVIGFNFWLWHTLGIDLSLAGPLIEIVLIFMAYLSYGFFFSSHQREQIQSMFGQYVAPAHIDALINDPEQASFEGETKEMTVLFCDVRSFTSISESLSANQLKDLLNRYFTPMTEIIFDHQGTVDKYVGDMIMAFWGAPLNDPQQRLHAVTAALKMQQETQAMRPMLNKLGYPEVNIGIGINTGMMNVGDMGSVYRRAYTVLGDAVNLGSRLESITKFYGSGLLVSESVLEGIGDHFLSREVDYIQVKGKKEAIKVYEPLSLIKEASAERKEFTGRYHTAREFYLKRDWETAKKRFHKLLEEDPTTETLYRIYLDRIALYENSPPAEDWQGVWKHDSK